MLGAVVVVEVPGAADVDAVLDEGKTGRARQALSMISLGFSPLYIVGVSPCALRRLLSR
jgi:hypothetical protein